MQRHGGLLKKSRSLVVDNLDNAGGESYLKWLEFSQALLNFPVIHRLNEKAPVLK